MWTYKEQSTFFEKFCVAYFIIKKSKQNNPKILKSQDRKLFFEEISGAKE